MSVYLSFYLSVCLFVCLSIKIIRLYVVLKTATYVECKAKYIQVYL